MAGRIRIVKNDFERLREELLSNGSAEQGAALFASHCLSNGYDIF